MIIEMETLGIGLLVQVNTIIISQTNTRYSIYTEESVNRIKYIKRIQELGFTLAEISKLLGVVDKVDERCNDMYNFVVNKIEEDQTRIRDLKGIEQMLLLKYYTNTPL